MHYRLELVPISTSLQSQASRAVEDGLSNRLLSNRTNPARYKRMLAAVMTVMETRKSVEITDLEWGDGKSPAYNLAHRMLSTALMRPYFGKVQVIALDMNGLQMTGNVVSGHSNTTATTGKVRLFVTPK